MIPADLSGQGNKGWYRIPLDRAPRRIAADYLTVCRTGTLPAGRTLGGARTGACTRISSRKTHRADPRPPEHPWADQSYYKVMLGPLAPLPHTVPSRRLRRIAFIPTTLDRLMQAEEINDLSIKSSAQERLWAALKLADIDAERQYPLADDLPTADFALLCRDGPRCRAHRRRTRGGETTASSARRSRPTTCWLRADGPWCDSQPPSWRPMPWRWPIDWAH